MEIKTRHRGSADGNRPKGRALLALAERREVPVAALFAALTVGMAAWVKSAFGGNAAPVEEAAAAPARAQDAAVPTLILPEASEAPAMPVAPLVEAAAGPETAEAEAVADLGRIGRGPGAPDLSRFFQIEEPALDLPAVGLAPSGPGGASARQPGVDPIAAGAAPNAAPDGAPVSVAQGGGSGSPATGTGAPGTGGGAGADEAAFAGIGFETLFARFAEVARPFHPATVRDIGHAAIGDWISAQELHRLRGSDSRPDAEAAFMARETQTYQLLSNAEGREAFLDRHFPSQSDGDGGAAQAAVDAGGAAEAARLPDAVDGIL